MLSQNKEHAQYLFTEKVPSHPHRLTYACLEAYTGRKWPIRQGNNHSSSLSLPIFDGSQAHRARPAHSGISRSETEASKNQGADGKP